MSKLKQLLFSLNEPDRRVIEEKLKEKDKEISKLQASCKSAISSFVRMETLYGIESKKVDLLNEQLAEKDKEIKKLNWQLKDKDFTIKNLNHSLSVAPNANAGQRARIDELTKIVKEKDKEVEELKQQLAEKDKLIEFGREEIRKRNKRIDRYENMFRSRIKRTGDMQKGIELYINQLAIQELEKAKEDCFNQKELVNFGNVACFMVDIADILEIINNQIKELKGEKEVED